MYVHNIDKLCNPMSYMTTVITRTISPQIVTNPIEWQSVDSDLISIHNIILGLVNINVSDFVIFRFNSTICGHQYKLFHSDCRKDGHNLLLSRSYSIGLNPQNSAIPQRIWHTELSHSATKLYHCTMQCLPWRCLLAPAAWTVHHHRDIPGSNTVSRQFEMHRSDQR